MSATRVRLCQHSTGHFSLSWRVKPLPMGTSVVAFSAENGLSGIGPFSFPVGQIPSVCPRDTAFSVAQIFSVRPKTPSLAGEYLWPHSSTFRLLNPRHAIGKRAMKVVAQHGTRLPAEHLISSVNLKVEVQGAEFGDTFRLLAMRKLESPPLT